MAAMKKSTPSSKPTIAGLKKMNLDKTAGKIQGLKQANLDKTATAKPTPKVKVAPMPTLSAQQKQEKALNDLMKKRAAQAKKTGSWPNYGTN